MKKLLVAGIALVVIACGGVWGTITKFEVNQPFSLMSTSSKVVQFAEGPQNLENWSLYDSGKRDKPELVLVRKSDKAKFNIDKNKIVAKHQLVRSQPVNTNWQESWQSCTYQESYQYCHGYGQCGTGIIIRQGRQLVRTRIVGSYDDYETTLSLKNGQSLADINATMDYTSEEIQLESSCY